MRKNKISGQSVYRILNIIIIGITVFSCNTNDNFVNNSVNSSIDQYTLVWQQVNSKFPEKWKWQIQYMTQDTAFPITNDTNWNTSPSVFGDSVVWVSPNGVYLWYHGNTVQIHDDPDLHEQNPVISSDLISWFAEGRSTNTSEIYAHSKTGLKRITNNNYWDGWPSVYKDTIFWVVDTSGYTATHAWCPDTTWPFTAANLKARGVKKSGNSYVWFMYDGNDYEIMMMKNDSIFKLTDNNLNDWYPDIDGDRVIWVSGSNTNSRDDHEIMIWENGNISQLTSNNEEENLPVLRGQYIVWYAKDGSDVNDNEIYMYDGHEIKQITNNTIEDTDPDIYIRTKSIFP